MADITRAFENLNRSLRHISDSNMAQKQNEMQHEENKAKLQAELNDPRRKLAQAQAQDQLSIVGLTSPINFGQGTLNDAVNTKLKDGLNAVLKEHGAEYNNGKIVNINTDVEFTGPKHLMTPIDAAVQKYMSLSQLPSNIAGIKQADRELQISNIKDDTGGMANVFQQRQLDKLNKSSDAYKLKMSDPNEQMRQLDTDKMYLEKTLNDVLLRTNNKMLVSAINGRLDRNQKDRALLADDGGVKNVRTYTYHHKEKDGSYTHIKHAVPFGKDVPGIVRRDGKIFRAGTRPQSGKGSGGLTHSQMLTNLRYQKQTVKEYTDLSIAIAASEIDETQEESRNRMVAQGMDKDKADKLSVWFLTNSATATEKLTAQQTNLDDLHEGMPWWVRFKNIGKKKKFKSNMALKNTFRDPKQGEIPDRLNIRKLLGVK